MWNPEYYEVSVVAAALSKDGSAAETPERVRYASPYEWGAVIDIGMTYAADVRLGLVSKLSARLGDGWVLVVPESDEAYLVDDTGSTGEVASTLLWVKVNDLTPTLELRTKPRKRRT